MANFKHINRNYVEHNHINALEVNRGKNQISNKFVMILINDFFTQIGPQLAGEIEISD